MSLKAVSIYNSSIGSSSTFYPSIYGATPNDATGATNSVAIQAALNAANANGGGVVYLDRPGVYLVNGINKVDTSTINFQVNSALVISSNTFK